MGHRRRKSARREIPTDIIPNILMRLPTKDFARSSCVCKLWCSMVADPSFRKLHAAHATTAASSEPEVLLITETSEPGRSDEASVFNLSSGKALCQVSIPSGYRHAGVCNDLLCFAHDHGQAPAMVCNPITGETLQLPKAPPLHARDARDVVLPPSHLFVLGFSASTNEYKMFRLSFPRRHSFGDETNYIAVYTLGDNGGWRQRSYLSRFHPFAYQNPAPVHIDGKIFVPTADMADTRARAARMLVLDVATETPLSYPIPYNFNNYNEAWDMMLAEGFELNGQMCLVVPVGFYPHNSREKIQFWVMKPLGEIIEGKNDDDDEQLKLYWDKRYSFFFDDPDCVASPRSVWIDHAQTLCCMLGTSLYKYDMRGYSSASSVDSVLFDKKLDLSDALPRYRTCRWSIRAGYRPSLLSPLIFALPPSQDEKGKKRPQYERTFACALMELDDEHTDGT